jgi:predicted aspartyl protease
MGNLTMGKVTVPIRVENLGDCYEASKGRIRPEEIRSLDLDDAVVDTGATMLSLPARVVRHLDLKQHRTRTARTTAGIATFRIFEAVRLTIHGRDCVVEVAEIPNDCPALVGQVPLELLDFVVDPGGQRLIGNPEHGGNHMFDMFTGTLARPAGEALLSRNPPGHPRLSSRFDLRVQGMGGRCTRRILRTGVRAVETAAQEQERHLRGEDVRRLT